MKKAFEILEVGGELIVEHMPYAVHLPAERTKALTHLMQTERCDLSYLNVAAPHSSITDEPGMVAKLLQEADPFTIYMTPLMHEEMRAYLANKAKGNVVSVDSQKLVDYEVIDTVVDLLATSFNINMRTTAGMIHNGLVSYYKKENEKFQKYYDLFAQYYFMMTQEPILLKTLGKIGYENVSINYNLEPNPYNGRKYSWIIKGNKSVASKND